MTAQRPLAVCAEIEAARDKSGQKKTYLTSGSLVVTVFLLLTCRWAKLLAFSV